MTETPNPNPEKTGEIQKEKKDTRFKPGVSGNPKGKPPGSISAISRVKKIFQDSPEEFKAFIEAYIKDPANRKHIVEMIDGKPRQTTDVNLEGRVEIDNLAKDIKELLGNEKDS